MPLPLKRFYLTAHAARHPWWKAARAARATLPSAVDGLLDWRRMAAAPILNLDYDELMAFYQWASALPGWHNDNAPVSYLDREDEQFITGRPDFNRDKFDAAYRDVMRDTCFLPALAQCGTEFTIYWNETEWRAEVSNVESEPPTASGVTPHAALDALVRYLEDTTFPAAP